MIETLDETNFLLYAAKHYDNPNFFDTLEFNEDLSRFKYLKRLFNRYEETLELKERLILNHIVILYNVFGDFATKMMFLKLEGYYGYLKPFLVFVGRMPDVIRGVGIENKTIYSSDIEMDAYVVRVLRELG